MASIYLKGEDFELSIATVDLSGYSRCRLTTAGRTVELGTETIQNIREKFQTALSQTPGLSMVVVGGRQMRPILALLEEHHQLHFGLAGGSPDSLHIIDRNGKSIFCGSVNIKILSDWKKRLK